MPRALLAPLCLTVLGLSACGSSRPSLDLPMVLRIDRDGQTLLQREIPLRAEGFRNTYTLEDTTRTVDISYASCQAQEDGSIAITEFRVAVTTPERSVGAFTGFGLRGDGKWQVVTPLAAGASRLMVWAKRQERGPLLRW